MQTTRATRVAPSRKTRGPQARPNNNCVRKRGRVVGWEWKPPSAHTSQAERPMRQEVEMEARWKAQTGGCQKAFETAVVVAVPEAEADKVVRTKGMAMATARERRPCLAMAIFWAFLFLVVVVEGVEVVAAGSSLGRCVRFWEAMGGRVKRREGEVGEGVMGTML